MSQTFEPLAGSDLFANSYPKINAAVDAAATNFIGSTAPSIVPGRLWVDTTADEIKIGNEAGDAWITLLKYGSSYGGVLPVAGGGMAGPINMNGQLITNLALGTGLSAARQQEVDLKAPIASPVFTDDARVSQDPAGNDSLIRRSWAEGRYAKLTGSALTGQIILGAYAGAAYEVPVLEQLQNFVGFNVTSGHRHDGADARRVRGSDIDAGAAADGVPLRAVGSGATAFARLKGGAIDAPWGVVASAGTILGAGSANWSVTRPSAGTYEITAFPGAFVDATPTLLATPYAPSQNDLRAHAEYLGSDVVRVRIATGTAVLTNCAFSFLFL